MACGAALPSIPARAIMWPVPGPGSAYSAVPPPASPFPPSTYVSAWQLPTAQLTTAQLVGCEHRLERTRRAGGRRGPTGAIVGASCTAGVGSGQPDGSWAALLARD